MPKETQALTAEKQTLLALRALRRRVEELEQAQREPVAIVGMACRLPGGVQHPQGYWDLLAAERSAVSEIPPGRLDLDPIFDPRPQTPGKTYSRWAGLLAAPGDFDAEFFGISPREAGSADPQQRLLLETSWEALEDAGIVPQTLAGEDVGIFIGISHSEYAHEYQKCVPREELAAHLIQGSALNAAAGRLSYFYGFRGPSLAIDTACSSSLVAVDRACRSLLQLETKLVLAGGVSLLASPEMLIMASQWGMLSPTGVCRAFDAAADGFVRGEGCGVVVLKRLRDAEAAGDRILGVILGSAVNQDGASSGLTVPNGQAQQELLRKALANAQVEAWQVGYVEAHGTGTALGDPIEAEALGVVFGSGRKRERPLLIGSVKTNLGHLEAAAGIAGLIKVLLGFDHGVVPAQLHWERPSEHVRWNELPLEVVTEARPWAAIDGRRIAGVSSFGFSGTNAHVVLEAWTGGEQPEARDASTAKTTGKATARPAEVLVVTARTEPALRALAARYAEYLERSEADWEDICHTAATGRGIFAERLAVVAANKAEAAQHLRAWLSDQDGAAGVGRGRVRLAESVRVGLVLGHDGEQLDRLIGVSSAEQRSQAWQAKLRSWGVDLVAVVPAGQEAAQELEAAGATVALVLGEAATGLPAVEVKAGWSQLCSAVAELFVRGVPMDWSGWEAGRKLRRVALPTYAFQRERYWIPAQNTIRPPDGIYRSAAGDAASPMDQMKTDRLKTSRLQMYRLQMYRPQTYRLEWRPRGLGSGLGGAVAESVVAGGGRSRRVLLLGTPDRVDGVAGHLRQNGAAVVCAPAGERLPWSAGFDAVVYFANFENTAQDLPLGDVTGQTSKSLRALLSLAQEMIRLPAQDLPVEDRPTEDRPRLEGLPRLFVVTEHAYAIAEDGAELHLLETPVAGLAQAIALEAPELRCTLIDGGGGESSALPAQIAEEVLGEALGESVGESPGESVEQRVAFRSGRRHVARLERFAELTGSASRAAERRGGNGLAGGVHLITGGLRGLGLKLAEWLVEQGAHDLILVGRRPPTPEALESIAHLTAQGAAIRIVQGDIADLTTAERAVGVAGSRLRGVWHCAGVLDNEPLAEQSWERFRSVMRPKVDGAWNLHMLTRDSKLEYFVLYSSWASLSGSRLQANYCAANAFLDGLANFRKAHGLPALSVNWGVWQGTGLGAGESYQRIWARAGQQSMKPADALAALQVALNTDEPQLAIAAIDWPRYLSLTASSSQSGSRLNPLYAEVAVATGGNVGLGIGGSSGRKPKGAPAGLPKLPMSGLPVPGLPVFGSPVPGSPVSGSPVDSTPPAQLNAEPIAEPDRGVASDSQAAGFREVLREVLNRATPSARRPLLMEHLRRQAGKSLSLAPGTPIDQDAALHDLGLDSLMAVELRNALQLSLGRPLSATLALDHPTLRALCDILLQEIFAPEQSEKIAVENAAAPRAVEPVSHALDDLAESEAEALLLLELKKMELEEPDLEKTDLKKMDLEKSHAAKH